MNRIDELRNDFSTIDTKKLLEKYEVSYSTIERFCKRNGFRSRRKSTNNTTKLKYKKLNANIPSFIFDWQNNSLSIEELEEKYEAPRTALYSKANSHNVKRKTLRDKIDVELLILDYKSRIKTAELLSKYGISDSTKRRILNSLDIKPLEFQNPKYIFNYNYFDEINTEGKAYFLGLIFADGSHAEKRHCLSITLQKEDDYILKKFTEELGMKREVSYVFNKKYKKYYASISAQNKHFSENLIQLGVVNNKSFKIKFPDYIPSDLISHFIRGYFDGDGGLYFSLSNPSKMCVSFAGNKLFLSSMSNHIMKEINLKSLALYSHKTSPIYTISKGGRYEVLILLNYIYDKATIFLDRKYKKYLQIIQYNESCKERRS